MDTSRRSHKPAVVVATPAVRRVDRLVLRVNGVDLELCERSRSLVAATYSGSVTITCPCCIALLWFAQVEPEGKPS